jgi:predicted ATPase
MDTSPERPTPYVFLSYASADRERALVVADLLEGRGVSVWIDRKSIAGGTSWSAEIVEGIKGCAVLVVLVSVAAMQSRNVTQEIQLGWEHDRKILPLLLEPTSLPGAVEYALAGRQWVEVLNRREADWLDDALRALGRLGYEPPRRQVPAAQAPALLVTSSAEGETRNNLPASLTSFIGRQEELAQVERAVAENRLVTLTGTGGCGKTRLAVEVARRSLDRHLDGVWLVELAPLSDPSLVVPSVLVALGKPEVAGEAPIATLVGFLKSRELLVILDNCEHLIEACARLAEALLRVCPKVRILATSRELLGLAGELAWRIPSLPVPDADGPFTAQALGSFAAVELFVERARTARSDFRLTERNARALGQIVRRLDGIPLAIELAATRVRGLNPEEILQRLDDRFRLLTGGSRTALRRQQTLRALIDWSYDLLTADEQALLRRLAVLAGSFSLEAAEAVCSAVLGAEDRVRGDGESEPRPHDPAPTLTSSASPVLDLLFELVDKSLVLAEPQDDGARYHLLETVRQYAGEKLVDAGEASEVRVRHRDYFLDLAERAFPRLRTRDQKTWSARLEREVDNFRAALDWSEADPDVDRHLSLAGALGPFWGANSRWREGGERLDVAVGRTGWTSVLARARALAQAAYLARLQDRRRDTMRLAGEAIPLARQAGDVSVLVTALFSAFMVGRDLGEPNLVAYLEEAIAAARQAENQRVLATGLILLGDHIAWTGDREAGRQQIEEGLRVARAVEDPHMSVTGYWYLATLALRDGNAAEAERQVAALRQLEPSLGPRSSVYPMIFQVQTEIALKKGNLTSAREACVEGLRFVQRVGGAQMIETMLGSWAAYCLARGDARSAAGVLGALDACFDRTELKSLLFREKFVDPAIAVRGRQTLGAEAYEAAYAEGRQLSLEQALERALASATADSSLSSPF